MEDSTATLSRSVGRFFSGTLLSRVSGLLRDITMAAYFGSHASVAAFMVAFRFSHLLRRLLGEGALHAAFVPQFEEQRKQEPELASHFFRDLMLVLTFLLVGVIFVAEGVLWWALSGDMVSAGNREIMILTQLMLPSLLFICLFGLNSGLLQCERSYFLPAISPVAFNLIWIASIFFLRDYSAYEAMQGLAVGVAIACFVQWIVTVPKVWNLVKDGLKGSLLRGVRLWSEPLKKMSRALLLGILGVGAVQINSAFDYIFARYADPSGPSYLWFSIRVQQLPIGLFGVALAGALLPPLSRACKRGELSKFRTLLGFAIERASAFTLPFTFACWVGGAASLNLLYGRGEFDTHSLLETTRCLWAYAAGIFPTILVMIIAPAFYAKNSYRVPVRAAVYAVGLNISLNGFLVFGMGFGAAAVALATSLSALFNAVYLMRHLSLLITDIQWQEVITTIFRVSMVCALSMLGTALIAFWTLEDPTVSILTHSKSIVFSEGLPLQLGHFLLIASSFSVFTCLIAWVARVQEFTSLFTSLLRVNGEGRTKEF